MVVGSNNWEEGTHVNGIVIVSRVRILGIQIDRKLEQLEDNWTLAIEKMMRYAKYVIYTQQNENEKLRSEVNGVSLECEFAFWEGNWGILEGGSASW
jgi:hypothetical protein